MRREFVRFSQRTDRPRWVSTTYGHLLEGSVLDVGCDEAVLRDFVTRGSYVGLDRTRWADLHHDLQAQGPFPFEDEAFDTVVCTDVLEHLDNLHDVFGECVRVARRNLLISLPNCWSVARVPLRRGRGSFTHYGLPAEPPPDRHRWFFSHEEAHGFLEAMATRHGLLVRDLVALEKPRPRWLRIVRRLRYPREASYLNLYSHTLVAHLAKDG